MAARPLQQRKSPESLVSSNSGQLVRPMGLEPILTALKQPVSSVCGTFRGTYFFVYNANDFKTTTSLYGEFLIRVNS